jgi:hypothetical protein
MNMIFLDFSSYLTYYLVITLIDKMLKLNKVIKLLIKGEVK